MKKISYLILAIGFSCAIFSFSPARAAVNDSKADQLAQLTQLQNTLAQLQQQEAVKETLDQLQTTLNDIQYKIQNNQIPSDNIPAVLATLSMISGELNQINLTLNMAAPSVESVAVSIVPKNKSTVSIFQIQPAAQAAQKTEQISSKSNISTAPNINSQLASVESSAPTSHSINKRKVLKIAVGLAGTAVLLALAWLLWANNKREKGSEMNYVKSQSTEINKSMNKSENQSQSKANWQAAAEWKVQQGKEKSA